MFTKRVQRHDSQQMNYKVGETSLCRPWPAVLLICASFSRRKTYNSTATSTPYSQRGTHCLCFARIVVHRFALCAVLWLIFVYKGPCSVACRISVGNFHPPKGSAKCTQLSPGFHSLANDVTPDSDWPKERRLKQGLLEVLSLAEVQSGGNLEPHVGDLFQVLGNSEEEETIDSGMSRAFNSTVFVAGNAYYGTLTSTVLLWDHADRVSIFQRYFSEGDPRKVSFSCQMSMDLGQRNQDKETQDHSFLSCEAQNSEEG